MSGVLTHVSGWQLPAVMAATTPSALTVAAKACCAHHYIPNLWTVGGGGVGLTPGRTPLRDQLGLNDPDAAIAAENRRAEKVACCALMLHSCAAPLAHGSICI